MNIIAHRGRITTTYPENTKETFLACVNDQTINGVECDVQFTNDNQTIISHYNYLACTSYKFMFNKISSLNHDEVFNSKFHPDTLGLVSEIIKSIIQFDINNLKFLFKYIGSRGTFTDLGTFLSILNNQKQILLHIKMPNAPTNKNIQGYEKILFNILKDYRDTTIYIQSYNPYVLKSLKKTFPNFKVGLSVRENLSSITDEYDFISINQHYLNKRVADQIFANKQQLMIWTVDTKLELKHLQKMLGSHLNQCILISKHAKIIARLK